MAIELYKNGERISGSGLIVNTTDLDAPNIGDGLLGDDVLVGNQNSDNGFKFWSGTLDEYNGLTPEADTLYNITDDSTSAGVVSFDDIEGTPTTVSGYGITDVADVPSNDVVNFNGSTDLRIWAGTQAQFDAITEITDGSVVYIIRS